MKRKIYSLLSALALLGLTTATKAQTFTLGFNISSEINHDSGDFAAWSLSSGSDDVTVQNFRTTGFTKSDNTSVVKWWGGDDKGVGWTIQDTKDFTGSYGYDIVVPTGKNLHLARLRSDVLMDDNQLSLQVTITDAESNNKYISSTQTASDWRNTLDTDIDVLLPTGTYTVMASLSNMSSRNYYLGALQLTGELTGATKYTINFKDDESVLSSTEYYAGAEIVLPSDPSKEGYTFNGWSGLPDGNIMPENDLNVTATWNNVTTWVNSNFDHITGWYNDAGVKESSDDQYFLQILKKTDANIYQVLTGMDDGYYKLEADVYYYPTDLFSTYEEAPTANPAYLYINESKQLVPNSFDAIYLETTQTLKGWDKKIGRNGANDGDTEYNRPYNQTGIVSALATGKYHVELITQVTGGTIRAGLTGEGSTILWMGVDNMNLTFLGADAPAAVTTQAFSIGSLGVATIVTPKQNVTLPSGMKAYKATSVGTENITMKLVDGVIPPFTPLLVKGDAGNYEMTFTNDAATADVSGNLLVGYPGSVYVSQTQNFSSYDYYSLNGQTEETLGFYKRTASFDTSAGKAYLCAPVGSGGDVKGFIFNDSETAIQNIQFESETNGAYFDLSGRRLSIPTQKGLYIHNGKKVIIK